MARKQTRLSPTAIANAINTAETDLERRMICVALRTLRTTLVHSDEAWNLVAELCTVANIATGITTTEDYNKLGKAANDGFDAVWNGAKA